MTSTHASSETSPDPALSPAAQEAYEQAIENLSGILAHRLRSFVSSIEGFTDLLTVTLDSPDQRDMALRIFEGAAHIERILADLQHYSQRPDPVLQPIPLGRFLNEVRTMIGEEADDRVYITAAAKGELYADPLLLRQALWMVLQNALDATDASAPVLLDVARRAGTLQFEVWNEGLIDADPPEVIFQPFYTTKAQNLGVGLPLARRVVQAHGGDLWLAYTDPEEGTAFALTVPATPDAVPPALPAASVTSLQGEA